MLHGGNISRYSSKSEEDASELLEDLSLLKLVSRGQVTIDILLGKSCKG